MALGVNALTTWERAKACLSFSDDQKDAVEFLIDAVSSTANRISSRKLKARAYDLQLDGRGSDKLIMPEFPIASITSISIDSTRAFTEDTALDSSEYRILPNEGIIQLYSGIFPNGIGNIKVVGSLGYTTVPEDLEFAVIECVGYNRRRLESGTTGIRQTSANGSVTSQYELGLPLSVREVFESYRGQRI